MTHTRETFSAQDRIDRSLVKALLIGGLVIGAVGVADLGAPTHARDFVRLLGGLGLAVWSGFMLARDQPRPTPILVAAAALSLAFLVGALISNAPAVDFAAPSTITLIATTGIVAMSSVARWRWVGAVWLVAVVVGALIIDAGSDAGVTMSISDAIVTGTVAAVGMYMVGVSRQLLEAEQHRYRHLADAAVLAVTEIDVAGAAETLNRSRVTSLNQHEKLTDLALRDEVIEGVRIVAANDRALSISDSESVEDTRKYLQRMLRSPRHEALLDRVATTILDGTPAEYVSQLSADEYILTKWVRNPSDPFTVTALGVDISDLKQAERALEEEIRSKDQFIASVSHELRTPLTAVLGLAEELRSETTPIDDGERKELLNIIAEQTRDISGIVEDLLVAARAEIGEIAITSEPTNLVSLVGQSMETTGVVATVQSPPALLSLGDPSRIRQILRNMLTNAQRYGGSSIRVTGVLAADWAVLEIRDDGPPLEVSDRDRIFSPYQRGHRPTTGAPDSVGLGLTVSRTLAELMGGSLTYRHDGRESVFRLSLPRAD